MLWATGSLSGMSPSIVSSELKKKNKKKEEKEKKRWRRSNKNVHDRPFAAKTCMAPGGTGLSGGKEPKDTKLSREIYIYKTYNRSTQKANSVWLPWRKVTPKLSLLLRLHRGFGGTSTTGETRLTGVMSTAGLSLLLGGLWGVRGAEWPFPPSPIFNFIPQSPFLAARRWVGCLLFNAQNKF